MPIIPKLIYTFKKFNQSPNRMFMELEKPNSTTV